MRSEERYILGQLKSALKFRCVLGKGDKVGEFFLRNHPLYLQGR